MEEFAGANQDGGVVPDACWCDWCNCSGGTAQSTFYGQDYQTNPSRYW